MTEDHEDRQVKTKNRKGLRAAACIVVAVAALAILFFKLGGTTMFNKDYIVGKNIKIEEVTEFYYTYDASTFPPDFQRYHFYLEDGKHMFRHEKREGNHWPLTEDDVTVAGSMELSDEEWAEFADYIEGGIVTSRDDLPVEDGGSGPWLFIYWPGDNDKFQVFDFDPHGKVLAFEEFCEGLKEKQMNE